MSVEPKVRVRYAMARGRLAAGGAAGRRERSAAGDRNPWLIVGGDLDRHLHGGARHLDRQRRAAHIAGGLAVCYDEATWVPTSFLVANAIVIPVSGWLANVLGRKRYYMISRGAVHRSPRLLCGIAPNLTLLILARVAAGRGGRRAGGRRAVDARRHLSAREARAGASPPTGSW